MWNVIKYWWTILLLAKTTSFGMLDIKGHVMSGILIILTYLSMVVLSTYGIVQIDPVDDMVGDFVSWGTGGIGLLVAVVLLLLFNFLIQPALIDNKLHKEKKALEASLNELEKRISRKNIKPVWPPISFIHNNNRQKEVLFYFENDSGKELSSYYARIEKVGFRKNKEQETNQIDFPSNMKLLFPGTPHRYVKDETPIAPGDRREISVAETKSNNFKFVTEKSTQDFYKDVGYYSVRIMIGGVVDGIGIKNLVDVEVNYSGGNEIDISHIQEYKEQNE